MSSITIDGAAGAEGLAGQPATATANTPADANNTATAAGGAGGGAGNGAGPNAGVGGAAQATATTTIQSMAATSAVASATGGAGGDGIYEIQPGGGGAPGGAATANATATGGADVVASAIANAGNGGFGAIGGVADNSTAFASGANSAQASVIEVEGAAGADRFHGFAGQSVTLTNAVSGETEGGVLTLQQTAVASAGGYCALAGGGAGGQAISSLVFDDTQNATKSGSLVADVSATGGAGGGGEGGGAGGDASATLTLTGISKVSGSVQAAGGAAGNSVFSSGGGVGGTATAVANVTSLSGNATAAILAPGSSFLAPATVSAQVASSQSVTATAIAYTDGALATPSSNSQEFIAVENAPTSDAADVEAQNAAISTAFATVPGFSPSTVFALAQVRGASNASLTQAQTVDDVITLNIANPDATKAVELGFYNGQAVGDGVASVAVSVSIDGAAAFNDVFSSPAQLSEFFNDNALRVGGAIPAGPSLNIQISTTMTIASAASGYQFGVVVGSVSPVLSASVTVAQFLADRTALDALAQGFTVVDSAQNVASAFDALNGDAKVTAITLTDPGTPVLTLTPAQIASDTRAIGLITNSLFQIASTTPAYYAGGNGRNGVSTVLGASSAAVFLQANSRMDLFGSDDAVTIGANSNFGAYGTDDVINAAAGDAIWIHGNSAYNFSDRVFGSNLSVNVGVDSRMDLVGSDDIVVVSTQTSTGVYGAGDIVEATAGAALWIGDNGRNGVSDRVFGDDVVVALSANSRMDLFGSDDRVNAGAASNLGVYGSGDAVYASAGDALWIAGGGGGAPVDRVIGDDVQITLATSSGLAVFGGGDVVYAAGGDAVSFGGNGANGLGNRLYGDGSSITLSANARLDVFGANDSVGLAAGDNFGAHGAGIAIDATFGDNIWVSGNGATGVADRVSGDGSTISLAANSRLDVFGARNSVFAASSSAAGIDGDSNSVQLGDGDALWINGGSSNKVIVGYNDTIADAGLGTTFAIAGGVGKVVIDNFDALGVIDLIGGLGGYGSGAQAFAALTSDGAGGAELSLGGQRFIDFLGSPPSNFTSRNFETSASG